MFIQKRYVNAALLGALAGAIGMFCQWFFDASGTGVSFSKRFSDPRIQRAFDQDVPPQRQTDSYPLVYKALFLLWLKNEGEATARAATLCALLAIYGTWGTGKLRERKDAVCQS